MLINLQMGLTSLHKDLPYQTADDVSLSRCAWEDYPVCSDLCHYELPGSRKYISRDDTLGRGSLTLCLRGQFLKALPTALSFQITGQNKFLNADLLPPPRNPQPEEAKAGATKQQRKGD
jgi:hypothetical protein